MDGIGYHGDHDFMANDGKAFVRFDITVRVGDKFIHEETAVKEIDLKPSINIGKLSKLYNEKRMFNGNY